MKIYKIIFFSSIFIFDVLHLKALNFKLDNDSSIKYCINKINIVGNKKTKDYIILREIHFNVGDTISENNLIKTINKAQELVYNTSLFNKVNFLIQKLANNNIIVTVNLIERIYIYPMPQIKFLDRNFNEWYNTYNASLNRINYGVKFVDFNLSGRKDQLRIYLLNGFSKDFSINYTAPYSNAKLSEGFIIGAGFSKKKEIAIKTNLNNHLIYYNADSLKSKYVSNNYFLNLGYIIRKGFFVKQILTASFNHLKISDSILQIKNNPNYFNLNKNIANIFDVSYSYQYKNVNNNTYPLKGKMYFLTLSKRGLGIKDGINNFSIDLGLNKYVEMRKNWYTSFESNVKIKLPFYEAYINQKALGYADNYLRGLEYLVIDGVGVGTLKSTLKKKIFKIDIFTPFKIKGSNLIPISIFAKSFIDMGYVYNKNQFAGILNNKFIYTTGLGFDILTIYDVNFRIEYSFNQLGKKGLFLHTQSGF